MLGEDGTPDAALEWIEDWQAGIARRAVQARELAGRVDRLTGTARSRDGLVEVTVDATGMLHGLQLADGVRTRSGAQLAQLILATARSARDDLVGKVRRTAEETFGAGSETGAAVVASFVDRPAPPEPRR